MTLGMHPFNFICQMFNLCRHLALKCPKKEITGYQIESYSTQHCLNMDLLDITRISGGPRLDLIRWLQGQNCLANPLRCSLLRGTKTTLMVTYGLYHVFFNLLIILLYRRVEFITLRVFYCNEKPAIYSARTTTTTILYLPTLHLGVIKTR